MTLHDVETYGLNTIDKKYMIAFLRAKRLTPMQTIHAKCYDCMNGYVDGKVDCEVTTCPNHPYMRYNPHKLVGSRKLTKEHKARLRERLDSKKNA